MAILILAVLIVAMFSPVLAGYVPFPADTVMQFPPWADSPERRCCTAMDHAELGDMATQFYLWHAVFNSQLSRLEVPIWNHQLLMGTPLLAESTPGVFFPLNFLFAVISAPIAWTLLFIVRDIIIAATTVLFARKLGLSLAGSVVAALSFTFCGWTTAFNGRPHLDSAMWLPLMFWSIDLLSERVSMRRICLTGLAFALSVLGGHPEVAAQVLTLACIYAAWRLFPLRASRGRFFLAFCSAAVLSVLFASAQVLPTAEWLGRITRTLNTHWAPLPAAQMAGFVSRDLARHPNADGVFIPESASYAGAVVLVLSVIAFLWRRRSDFAIVALLGFISLEVSFGWQPFFWIIRHLPVIKGLPNSRFLVGVDFALAILAGMGLSAVLERLPEAAAQIRKRQFVLVASSAIGFTIFGLRLAGMIHARYYLSFALIAATAALLVFFFNQKIDRNLAARVFVLLAAADMVTYMSTYMPWAPVSALYPPNRTFNYLRQHAGERERVAAVDVVYGSNFELPYHLSSAAGYDFPLSRSTRFLSSFTTSTATISFESNRLLGVSKGALDLTGTRYFVATDWNSGAARLRTRSDVFRPVLQNGHTFIFENSGAIPLVSIFSPALVHVVPDEDQQFRAVTGPGFQPQNQLIVPRTVARYFGTEGSAAGTTIGPIRVSGSYLEISVQSAANAIVYVNETYYEGSTVQIDGQAGELIRANYNFTAVPVTRGQHLIRISYKTPAYKAGVVLSAASWILFGALLIIRRRRD
jgi:hypothetical protein